MDDCIFCKIARGEIPCYKVYEDDDVLAFLDLSQTTKGHTLVIPKNHYDNFLFVPKDIVSKVFGAAQKVAQAQVASLGAEGINILNNTNSVAGQTVMHFHVHVIPRYVSDEGFRIEMKENPNLSELSLPALADKIKVEIK
jgi:histidine triad (HIT) family protein